jgi:hypothetical protein
MLRFQALPGLFHALRRVEPSEGKRQRQATRSKSGRKSFSHALSFSLGFWYNENRKAVGGKNLKNMERGAYPYGTF